MSDRLAFQTQLASIMEVLANAAVAEICKLVDDEYAVVSLEMSQCQRENKALKRKLHLLELKVARAAAGSRLREISGGRARVQACAGDRPPSTGERGGGQGGLNHERRKWSRGCFCFLNERSTKYRFLLSCSESR